MIARHVRENNLNAREIVVRTEMRVASIDSVGARNARGREVYFGAASY